MIKKILKYIRSYDNFGKIAQLSVKGQSFNTVGGGLITILIRTIVGLYCIYRFYILANKLEYNVTSVA